MIGDWLLVVFQVTYHFYFNFTGPYTSGACTEILNVKMKICKSFSLLKHEPRILALEGIPYLKELHVAEKERTYAALLQ